MRPHRCFSSPGHLPSTSLHAALPQPDTPAPGDPVITDWHHIISVGRDSYVRTVQRGFLAPFGQPAAVATVTERIPAVTAHIGGAAPIEELVTTTL